MEWVYIKILVLCIFFNLQETANGKHAFKFLAFLMTLGSQKYSIIETLMLLAP
jgi:hypothetical protein